MADKAGDLIHEVIEAHGGKTLWDSVGRIDAEISADGFLFRAKHIRPLQRLPMSALTGEPRFLFHDYPEKARTSELIGNGEVRVSSAEGAVVASRSMPRKEFRSLRRTFWWDTLDFIYFAGYATWNYLVTPFLFLNDGFSLEYLGERTTEDGAFFCVRATFPDYLPTHCRTQTFYFDQGRLLRRLDYTAEVVGSWAHAAHFCDDYRDFGGLKFATRRRVRPVFFGKVMRAPVLVAIDVHGVKLVQKG